MRQDDIFGSGTEDQAGPPDLLRHLWKVYAKDIKKRLRLRAKEGKSTVTLEQALKLAPAADFVKFARSYLNKHRVVENFPDDANHGVKLSNDSTCVICPRINVRGTMQGTAAHAITPGLDRAGRKGTRSGGSVPIT